MSNPLFCFLKSIVFFALFSLNKESKYWNLESPCVGHGNVLLSSESGHKIKAPANSVQLGNYVVK